MLMNLDLEMAKLLISRDIDVRARRARRVRAAGPGDPGDENEKGPTGGGPFFVQQVVVMGGIEPPTYGL